MQLYTEKASEAAPPPSVAVAGGATTAGAAAAVVVVAMAIGLGRFGPAATAALPNSVSGMLTVGSTSHSR